MQEAVRTCVAETQNVDTVRTRMTDVPASIAPVPKCTKNEAEKSSLHKETIEEQFSKLAEAVDEKNTGS